MIPNCLGCQHEYEYGIEQLELGNNVAWEGLDTRGHLFVTIFNEEGEIIS